MDFSISNIFLSQATPQRAIQLVNPEDRTAIEWVQRGYFLRDLYFITKFVKTKPQPNIVYNTDKSIAYIPLLAQFFPNFNFICHGVKSRTLASRKYPEIKNLTLKREQLLVADYTKETDLEENYVFILDSNVTDYQYKYEDFAANFKLLKELRAKVGCCKFIPDPEFFEKIDYGFFMYHPWSAQSSYLTTYIPKDLNIEDSKKQYVEASFSKYKRQMYYHQYVERELIFTDVLDKSDSSLDPPNLINDYDSTYESFIILEYLKRSSQSSTTRENIANISKVITRNLNLQSSETKDLNKLRKLLKPATRHQFNLSLNSEITFKTDHLWSTILNNKILSRKLVCDKLSVHNTAYYMFHYIRTGVYVKIEDNTLVKYERFINEDFTSNWGPLIALQLNQEKGLTPGEYYSEEQSYSNFPGTLLPTERWRLNARLVNLNTKPDHRELRSEEPKEMIEAALKLYEIKDCEFFINKHDHAMMRVNRSGELVEPYNFVHPSITGKPIRIKYPKGSKFAPILSSHIDPDFADVLFPTPFDWNEQKRSDLINTTPWENRKNIAFFRGSATGAGTTMFNNQRIRLMVLSELWNSDEDKSYHDLLDAGITNWNIRAKKFNDTTPMDFVRPDKVGNFIKKFETRMGDKDLVGFTRARKVPREAISKYKYHVLVEGHAAPSSRISQLMSIGAVILWVKSQPDTPCKQVWFEDLLEEGIDYLSVEADLSNLKDVIIRCKNDDKLCQDLASSVLIKYKNYLTKDGILHYTQTLLNHIQND